MTKTEARVIRNVANRLRCDTVNADSHIYKALSDDRVRSWLNTWVIAPLDLINPDSEWRDPELADSLAR